MKNSQVVLVTGGAGYIGSHACKMLSQAGFLPVVYDNLSAGHANAVKWGPLVQADLKDRQALNQTLVKYKPFAVMHFAADALVEESVRNPGKYYENNFFSTLCLLEEMAKLKIQKIIFSSSCATYGIPSSTPIFEDHPQHPINPYGKSKLMIEQMLEDYEKAYGIEYASLRYFNAAGADLDAEIGENHKNETHLIPLILNTAQGLRPFISVFGTDYPTKDGSAVRDYIHVIDLIDAHIKALDYILKKGQSLKVNLGTGKGFSVLEVIEAVKKVTKKDFVINLDNKRAGDPPILYADCSRGNNLLGWQPRYSDLETIILSAWRWHENLKNKNL